MRQIAFIICVILFPQVLRPPSKGVVRNQSEARGKLATNSQDDKQDAQTSDIKAIADAITKDQQDRAENQKEEATNEKETMRSQLWLVRVGGVQTIALVLTLFAICIQARETARAASASAASVEAVNRQAGIMERQTKATEDAAIAARKTIEIIISKERARVSVEIGMFAIGHPNDPPNVSGVSYTVHCYGTTPANVVRTKIEIALKTLQNTPAFQSDVAMNLPAVLKPDDKGLGCVTLLAGVAGTDAQARCMKGDLYAYCHGWIIYKDIFGSFWDYDFTYMRRHDSQWMGSGRETAYEDGEDDNGDPAG